MKLCVLSDETFDDYSPAPFLKDFDYDEVYVKKPALDFIRELSQNKHYDVYLNLCDAGADEDRPGLDVVEACEELNLPYTGANPQFYNPTRERMQEVADAAGISFAQGFRATSLGDLIHAKNLRYPMIVKHPHSYASLGMTKESRVENKDQLEAQARRLLELFGSARIEEFIEGREVTCLVVDNPDDLSKPVAYPPGEVVFTGGETFQHTDVKWIQYPEVARVDDHDLVTRVSEMSIKMYLAMDGTGYGRTDIRVCPDGELVMLEINPNAAILYKPEEFGPADMPIMFHPEGYPGFFDRIFRAAILRQQLRIAREKK